MKIKKNLIIIGMMGSGKSTIGSILAKNLDFEFIDTDTEIEKKESMKIVKIFKDYGEKYFRKIEEKIILETLNSKKSVISLGGGSLLSEKIKKVVFKEHVSFWLNWNSDILIKRIRRNKNRPIAVNLNNKQLLELIKERSKVYYNANFKIECDNLKKNDIVKKIINLYEK